MSLNALTIIPTTASLWRSPHGLNI